MPPRREPTLTPGHCQILSLIGLCRFCTVPHLMSRKICTQRNLREKLKDLRTGWSKPLIKELRYGKRGGGKRHYRYYLTPYGKTVLERVGRVRGSVRVPGAYPQVALDYDHRMAYVTLVLEVLERMEAVQ